MLTVFWIVDTGKVCLGVAGPGSREQVKHQMIAALIQQRNVGLVLLKIWRKWISIQSVHIRDKKTS